MSDYKQKAEYNIDRALESSREAGLTYAILALTYATLNQDGATRELEMVISRLIDEIRRSTNFG